MISRALLCALTTSGTVIAIMNAILVTPTHAATPQPTKPAVTWTGRPEPVPIAFVYRDTAGDSAWTQSHELARKAIEAEFGARVRTVVVERVATASDADKTFRDLAARGYKVFFATDPIHSDAAARVATADYDVKVEQALGSRELINLRVYGIRHFEQAYLAGIIAAGNSSSSKLGFVAAATTPGALAEINAFTLGAQSVNPRATTQVIWTGSMSDAAADARAAETLIKRGVDVLIATTDSTAVAQVAERRRKRVVGWHADRSAVAPHAQVATVALDWSPFYKTAVRESFDYLCTKTDTSRGYREGAIKVIGLAKSLSRASKTRLDFVQTQLAKGEFEVFTGPVRSTTNTVMLAERAIGDEPWRKSMNVLVRGVTVLTRNDGPKMRERPTARLAVN